MRDSNNQPIWNIYLEKTIGGYRIIMPNELGIMEVTAPHDGIAVSWPVNPHFTGKHGIAEILQAHTMFAGQNIY